jgi:hypothetical protein
MAIYTPLTIHPANNPLTPLIPNKYPITKGDPTTKIPGATIFFNEALVEISIHF